MSGRGADSKPGDTPWGRPQADQPQEEGPGSKAENRPSTASQEDSGRLQQGDRAVGQRKSGEPPSPCSWASQGLDPERDRDRDDHDEVCAEEDRIAGLRRDPSGLTPYPPQGIRAGGLEEPVYRDGHAREHHRLEYPPELVLGSERAQSRQKRGEIGGIGEHALTPNVGSPPRQVRVDTHDGANGVARDRQAKRQSDRVTPEHRDTRAGGSRAAHPQEHPEHGDRREEAPQDCSPHGLEDGTRPDVEEDRNDDDGSQQGCLEDSLGGAGSSLAHRLRTPHRPSLDLDVD